MLRASEMDGRIKRIESVVETEAFTRILDMEIIIKNFQHSFLMRLSLSLL